MLWNTFHLKKKNLSHRGKRLFFIALSVTNVQITFTNSDVHSLDASCQVHGFKLSSFPRISFVSRKFHWGTFFPRTITLSNWLTRAWISKYINFNFCNLWLAILYPTYPHNINFFSPLFTHLRQDHSVTL